MKNSSSMMELKNQKINECLKEQGYEFYQYTIKYLPKDSERWKYIVVWIIHACYTKGSRKIYRAAKICARITNSGHYIMISNGTTLIRKADPDDQPGDPGFRAFIKNTGLPFLGSTKTIEILKGEYNPGNEKYINGIASVLPEMREVIAKIEEGE